jgi:dienelactone hydrolase
MNRHDRLFGLVLAATMLAGCGRSALVPATRALITRTPIPVFTPTRPVAATATATSTSTLVPSSTPTLASTPTLEPSATSTPEPTATETALPPTDVPPLDPPTAAPEIVLTPVDPANPQIGQHPYSVTLQFVSASGATQSVMLGFLLYLPRAYGQDPAQAWPLILFLHGSSENGSNPELVAANGLPQLLTGDADYPFIVVSPQAQGESDWNSQLRPLMALVDYIQSNYAVDVKRTYLTGLSMGGIGAWDLALNYPQRFAAAVPIAGGWIFGSDAIPKRICDLKDMPIWVFHGALDRNVFPKQSQLLVDALRACGSNVQFTLYPDADHSGAWTRAYADPALYEWLLAQHLP